MRPGRTFVFGLLVTAALSTADAGPAEAQLERGGGAAAGLVMGTLSGGYVTLAIVVARSRAGHYVYAIEELLGWQTAPVIIGAATGMVLGYVDAGRMIRGSAYGVGGAVTGYVLGRIAGHLIWEPPEGSWAGGAIGAGIGLVAAGLIGAFVLDDDDGSSRESAGGIPIAVRLPL